MARRTIPPLFLLALLCLPTAAPGQGTPDGLPAPRPIPEVLPLALPAPAPGDEDRIAGLEGNATGESAVAPAGAEIGGPRSAGPWWVELLYALVALPATLALVLVKANELALLPVPALVLAVIAWNVPEWRRQRLWTPSVVHVLAVLALVMIALINVAWVRAGGDMWTQRWVVIALCPLVPYVVYLGVGGPRYMRRRRHPDLDDELDRYGSPGS